MLSRLHVKGYKSLIDAEVALKPLTLLFGPNTAGKSNLLDAVQLLSRLATSHTLKEAFEPPCRGKPLESFTMGDGGVKALREQERLAFSIEADLHISDAIAKAVDREILEIRRPRRHRQFRQGAGARARTPLALPLGGGDAAEFGPPSRHRRVLGSADRGRQAHPPAQTVNRTTRAPDTSATGRQSTSQAVRAPSRSRHPLHAALRTALPAFGRRAP